MPLIPWEYIKKYLILPKIAPTKLGEKLTYYGLEAKIIEKGGNTYFEFDTLPNRSDLLSWWGIVQEIGIILNCQVKPVNFPIINESKEKLIETAINTNGCSEFYLSLIKNIEVKESPAWLKEWLIVNNVRVINNIVDSANLIILESGQPLHIFDYDTLPEKKIVIRQARLGEKINTFNGQELVLDLEDIIISSGEKVISLAGVIGTNETMITSHTKNILVECASFNPKNIKKTTERLNISTTASHFFSRGANLVLSPQQVLVQAISLITDTYQGDLNSKTVFAYQEEKKIPLIITISKEFITRKAGQVLAGQTIENIWRQLKFSYQKKENNYYITIPSSRPDITIPEDLLEELLRIYDYNKVIGSLP